jgi:UTP--glucose-1-phosphate uridylyltransferase
MDVTTAVIFAAGYGTRMLPITATVEKELLPILNRPVIDYVVADCVAAGITRVMFVIRPGSHGLKDYYLGNPGLEKALARYGKHEALASLRAIHDQAAFEFIDQPEGLGTVTPMSAAIPRLPAAGAFLVCDGDAFCWRSDGSSETADLIRTFAKSHAAGAVSALTAPRDQLHRYGILDIEQREGRDYLRRLVEKPAPSEAPSNLINISKYIFTPALFPYVAQVKPNPKTGERYLTDAITAAANDHPIVVHRAQGEFLDAGSPASWLYANMVVAQKSP